MSTEGSDSRRREDGIVVNQDLSDLKLSVSLMCLGSGLSNVLFFFKYGKFPLLDSLANTVYSSSGSVVFHSQPLNELVGKMQHIINVYLLLVQT